MTTNILMNSETRFAANQTSTLPAGKIDDRIPPSPMEAQVVKGRPASRLLHHQAQCP